MNIQEMQKLREQLQEKLDIMFTEINTMEAFCHTDIERLYSDGWTEFELFALRQQLHLSTLLYKVIEKRRYLLVRKIEKQEKEGK